MSIRRSGGGGFSEKEIPEPNRGEQTRRGEVGEEKRGLGLVAAVHQERNKLNESDALRCL